MSGVKYTVEIKDIDKFEHQNNISVNVYGCEDKKILRSCITPMGVARYRVNLLYITAGKTSHYVFLKDLSRLISKQNNNHNDKNISSNIVYMTKPVKRYWKKHWERCKLHGPQRIKLPEADNMKECNKTAKTEYQLRLPFVIYADFKSVLHKQDSCEPSSSKSCITQYQHHIPCGRCIYMKCSDGQYFEPSQVNIRDEAAEKLLDKVLAAATICKQHLTSKIPMKQLTQEQWSEYNNATNCSICAKLFKLADKKVRYHDHLTVNIEVQLTTHAAWITSRMPFWLISEIILTR